MPPRSAHETRAGTASAAKHDAEQDEPFDWHWCQAEWTVRLNELARKGTDRDNRNQDAE